MPSTPIQSISITTVSSCPTPSPHLEYHILISLPVKSWVIKKRYSDFIVLNSQLNSIQSPIPFTLPPKHSTKKLYHSISTLGGLWAGSSSTGGSTGGSGFLDLNSKDADEIQLQRERKNGLEGYLRAILSCNQDCWRESKVFKEFLEIPNNSSSSSSSTQTPIQNSRQSEASQRISQRQSQSQTSQSSTSIPPTRILGSQTQETSSTRSQSDQQLFESQNDAFVKQDSQLENLAAILRRQKTLGLDMNQELAEQNELLGTLDEEVGRVQVKMQGAEGKMKKLEGK